MFDVCSGCEDMAKRFEITRLDVECISMHGLSRTFLSSICAYHYVMMSALEV